MNYIKRLISIFTVMVFSIVMTACGSVPKDRTQSNPGSQIHSAATTDSGSGEENPYSNNKDDDKESDSGDNRNNVDVSSQLKVHFIDVGQADSILIQQGNENMLIDAGNNDDEDTLRSYINSLGIKEFTYVVGTHPHEDHIGSMDYIVNSFKVGKIYFPKTTATTKTFENLVKAVKNKGMQFTVPKVGETFNLGDAKCTILAPNSSKYEDANNYSIVIKLEYGNNSFLFTGDAEDVSEKEMLKNGLNLKADVLKAGHHGSSSSSTEEFLNAVNPKYAVISVGKDNDYGHPHKETLQKFSDRGIKVYRTDESGTIVATSDGNSITFSAGASAGNGGSSASSDTDINANSGSTKTNASGSTNTNSSSVVSDSSNTGTVGQSSRNYDGNSTWNKNGATQNITVWVSKNGGKVYHYDKSCSGMKNPNEMTLEEAESEGLRPCSKCGK